MTDPLIVEAMRRLGQSRSRKKRNAARLNGSLGGRPAGAKDSRPRKRGKGSQGVSERFPERLEREEYSQE